eukprot:Cvel_19036.t2-p1 / transcript=Cvel_19036.t2 / gene=Cvel_19036 / organism=Chromera_velia_CCMP2878 / gene_product=hypothetical protein / transcript_product=hypothetical protein / location=Cvel_scaffold1613:2276-7167(+) / protein_length=995 / sequence_SO=supercontig / SO=protein_coding / is_pseudo=false
MTGRRDPGEEETEASGGALCVGPQQNPHKTTNAQHRSDTPCTLSSGLCKQGTGGGGVGEETDTDSRPQNNIISSSSVKTIYISLVCWANSLSGSSGRLKGTLRSRPSRCRGLGRFSPRPVVNSSTLLWVLLLVVLWGLMTKSTALTHLPPSDIGRGDTWTEDTSVTYSGLSTFTKDYTGTEGCVGTYRARSNTQWINAPPWVWPPQGAFDRNPNAGPGTTSRYEPDSNMPGTSAASDANVELILELPCLMQIEQYGVQGRIEGTSSEIPDHGVSKGELHGSTDLSSWTLLGSYSGETTWTAGETRNFTADSTLGAFKYFKFVAQRVSGADPGIMCIADIHLWGEQVQEIPPSDIGAGTTWTKDPSVTYNGVKTVYKDYAGSVCPGRFRAMSSVEWHDDNSWYSYGSDEKPLGALFDRQTNTWISSRDNIANIGQSSGGEADVDLVLQTPCSVTLSAYKLTTRDQHFDTQSPSKAVVYGSTDGRSWMELGSYAGETAWTSLEQKAFFVNTTLGAFNYFKFNVRKNAGSADNRVSIADIELIGTVLDLCGGGSHNCDGNATCTNAGSSFTCACNYGFTGDGVSSCSALTLVPSADIGAGGTWTEDSSETYSGLSTFTKDYSGAMCPGTFRAKTNKAWNPSGTNLGYPSGAFDRKPQSFGESFYASGSPAPSNTGTDSGTNGNVELILDLPCRMPLVSFGIQPRETGTHLTQTPSQLVVSGSVDGGTSWTEVASYTGEVSNWEFGVTRGFHVNTSDANAAKPYSSFKFDIQKVSSATDGSVVVGDIELYTDKTLTQLPPPDIGRGDTWTRDASVTYNGIYTLYKDSSNSACPGRYRVRTNTNWSYNSGSAAGSFDTYEWPPSGAFDRVEGAAKSGYKTAASVSGTAAASDADVEVILELPCRLTLHSYGVQGRLGAVVSSETPSQAELLGSSGLSTWTVLGSFSGETGWAIAETRVFSADTTAGPFKFFKFVGKRISSSAGGLMSIGEVLLIGEPQAL